MSHPIVLDLKTLICRRCKVPCEPRANGWQHRRTRCAAPMRYGETCARIRGHAMGSGNGHRSRDGMAGWNRPRRARAA